MNDDLIRRFCESRYRWSIVAAATLLLGLVALLPAVDDYFDKRTGRSVLADDLVIARQTAEDLPKFESRVTELTGQLTQLEDRAVGEDQLGRYRNQIVDMARKSGCQVRRIDVGAVIARPWRDNDQPVAHDGKSGVVGNNTSFTLERRSVVLSVDGPMSNIHELLEQIQEQNLLAHPHRLDLHSSGRNSKTITMELELWLFALERKSA